MSNRDPLEELLSGLNRPVQPRPEFARALEHRLMAELGNAEPSGKDQSEMSHTAAPGRTWRVSAEPEPDRRRWLPVLEIAAVVLIAIGIGAAVLGSRGMLPGQSNDNHAASSTQYPITPGVEDCTVEPRTQAEVDALVPEEPDYSNPDEDILNPTEAATPPLDMQHHEANDEIKQGIEATVIELIACGNARDHLRTYALYTDDLIRTGMVVFNDMEETTGDQDQELVTLLDVSYIREFDDGHAAAVVVFAPKEFPIAITPLSMVFEKHGDRWLIDGFPMWWASAVGDSNSVQGSEGIEFATPIFTPTVVQKPTDTPES